jgi:Phosphotransferase enzyme family
MTFKVSVAVRDMQASRVEVEDDCDLDDLCKMVKDVNLSGVQLKDIGIFQLYVKSPDGLQIIEKNTLISSINMSYENPIKIEVTPVKATPLLKSKITRSHQQSGSTASASTTALLDGFGSLPSSFRVDATDNSVVWSELCPTDAEVYAVDRDMPLIGELVDLIPRGEDEAHGVSIILTNENSLFQSSTNGSDTLKKLGLEVGLARLGSKIDLLLQRGCSKPYGLVELKGGKYSPAHGNRQSAMYGSHVAINLLNRGVPRERVIVPSCTFTGTLIQFGATIVLQPSFTVFSSTSKVLDMSDSSERRLAIAYVRKANTWIDKLHSGIFNTSEKCITVMQLDESAYHIKRITDVVSKRGFQPFSEEGDTDISQGIEHWGRVLNILFADPKIRPHVAFPLAIRSPNRDEKETDHTIIYKDFCREGYRIGCPNRMNQTVLFDVFRNELRRVMALVHDAGVIHCDLYLSNVMWRENNSEVAIIIIDWDCAHCLIEGRFYPKVVEALEEHVPTCTADFGRKFDERYIDVLFGKLDESDNKHWIDLASDDKKLIDDAYYDLFSQMP